ncbi:MAG: prenyltransferase/squalene oxidase repeat-containing protein [Planctomycetota bacterium]|nr:prenyltransferase/squalene oxidase repeat-containing protein [Planctomycetota bacterium]
MSDRITRHDNRNRQMQNQMAPNHPEETNMKKMATCYRLNKGANLGMKNQPRTFGGSVCRKTGCGTIRCRFALAIAVLLVAGCLHPLMARDSQGITKRTEQAIDAGLTFLSGNQNENGSFGEGANAGNVGVVSLAGMAFMSQGSLPGKGKYGNELKKIVRFLLNHCQENGFINNPMSETHGPMYGHGFATLFLAEAYGAYPNPELRSKLGKAIQLIIDTQNPEGGWRYQPQRSDADLSVTICQVMALRAARNAGIYVPNSTIQRCVDYVRKSQNPDGGFRYILKPGSSAFPRTAAGIVALYSAGIYEGPEISKGLQYLEDHRPGREPGLEESHYFYGHYYAVQAMWQAGGKRWKTWYPSVRDELLELQNSQSGSWTDPVSEEYGTAMASIILQMPNNYLPIFQR